MKAVVAAFNQEKALAGAFSMITNLRMELFEALLRLPLVVTNAVMSSSAWSGAMSDGDGITIIVITRPCHADYLLSRGVTRACGQDRVTPSHVTQSHCLVSTS